MDQSSLRAGYFGKLPMFGDFIRLNAAGPEITALDQWIQEGLLAAKSRLASAWDGAYQQAPAYRFLFYPENAEHLLAGVLQKSQDKSGRKFPFIVSIKMRLAQYRNEELAATPALLNSFYENAEALLRRLNSGQNVPETLAQTGSLCLNSSPPHETKWLENRLAAATAEEFWTALLGRFDDPLKFLIFKNLSEILLPWRDKTPRRLSLGLRFPLGVAGPMMPLSASFWLQMSLRLLRSPRLMSNYFWTAAAEDRPSYFFLFFRRPSAGAFASLLQPDLQNDHLCALEIEGLEKLADAANNLPAAWPALLENPKLSLQEFLQSL
jgi:type VI secretion system ImpM family protein